MVKSIDLCLLVFSDLAVCDLSFTERYNHSVFDKK